MQCTRKENNEYPKDPVIIYADKRIYDNQVDLHKDQQQETVCNVKKCVPFEVLIFNRNIHLNRFSQ